MPLEACACGAGGRSSGPFESAYEGTRHYRHSSPAAVTGGQGSCSLTPLLPSEFPRTQARRPVRTVRGWRGPHLRAGMEALAGTKARPRPCAHKPHPAPGTCVRASGAARAN